MLEFISLRTCWNIIWQTVFRRYSRTDDVEINKKIKNTHKKLKFLNPGGGYLHTHYVSFQYKILFKNTWNFSTQSFVRTYTRDCLLLILSPVWFVLRFLKLTKKLNLNTSGCDFKVCLLMFKPELFQFSQILTLITRHLHYILLHWMFHIILW